uniref:Uncharacterized protein n=1 Tax=Romanomermis culicivorax TaxID=13658 RepID=A0A915KTN0_ROMCU
MEASPSIVDLYIYCVILLTTSPCIPNITFERHRFKKDRNPKKTIKLSIALYIKKLEFSTIIIKNNKIPESVQC